MKERVTAGMLLSKIEKDFPPSMIELNFRSFGKKDMHGAITG